jgi:SH3-like domain-containing protein
LTLSLLVALWITSDTVYGAEVSPADSSDQVVPRASDTGFVSVRQAPSTDSKEIAKLVMADRARYLQTKGGWHLVVEPRSKITGWVDAESTRVIRRKSVAANERVKHGSNVVVRAQPNAKAPAVGKLDADDSVRHLETQGNWHRVELANQVMGWVSSDYSKVLDRAKGEPYPVNVKCIASPKIVSRLSTGIRVPVKFRLWGPQPPLYLAYLYKYLATCAPESLRHQIVKGELAEIQGKAWESKLFPSMDIWSGEDFAEKRPQVYGALDDAIRILTDRFHSDGPPTEWVFPYPQDLKKISGRLERVRVGQSDLEAKEDPGAAYLNALGEVTDTMRDICIGHGYQTSCLGAEMVHWNVTTAEDGSRRAEYFTYLQHYDLEVTVELPSAFAQDLAEYAIYYLQATFPKSMRGKSAMYRPYFSMDVLADISPRSDPACWHFTEYTNDDGEGVADLIGSSPVDHEERVNVYVIEPYIAHNRPDVFSLNEYEHPFGTQDRTHNQRDIFFTDPPALGNTDEGHALHVAHIIGGIGSILDWTGFAAGSANVFLTSDDYFENTLLNQNLEAARQGLEPTAIIHNLSYSPIEDLRLPDPYNKLHGDDPGSGTGRTLSYMDKLAPLEKHEARELYVLAADHVSQGENRSRPATEEYYPEHDCNHLSCAGKYRNLLTVASLNDRWDGVMDGTVLPSIDIPVLAAPGVGILSADLDPIWEERGFRYRCGSSQAAAIVSAVAANLAVHHNLDGPAIKELLLATATPLPFPSVVGIVNEQRAMSTDPNEYTVWYEEWTGKAPVSGRTAQFYGPRQSLKRIPLKSDGYLRKQIVAIIRAPSDDAGHVQFRILYRTKNEKVARLHLSKRLRLDNISPGDGLTKRCKIPPESDADNEACVRIGRSLDAMHAVDLRHVTHIVFRRPRS